MSYVGGKARRCEHILSVLNNSAFDGMHYVEPFIGYAHILRRVENKKTYTASDANPLLVTLLQGVQNHKSIPSITENEYMKLKKDNENTSFRRSVAAFAYSYKGMQFTGYFDERRGRKYSDEHKRYYKKLQENEQFQKMRLTCTDYRSLKPVNKLIYCDPPYSRTTGYNQGEHFDNNEFWKTMRQWSKHNIVFISEYEAPSDFKCISCCRKYNQLSPTGNPTLRTERLFVHISLLHRLPKDLTTKFRTSTRRSNRSNRAHRRGSR